MAHTSPVVVVTGANGLVGTAVCRALAERSAQVRAVVRRAGSAPALDAVTEYVGEFADVGFARVVSQGADAVVTTVHPMGSSREVQHRVGVEGTPVLAQAARDAGVARLVHVSTAGVYDRSAGVGDVAEDGALLPEGSGAYADTKNATDAALAQVAGLTTVLVRPPAILGAGETSVWNRLRPQAVLDGERRANPSQTWSWVHVDDLAEFIADVATGAIATADDPEQGPVAGGTTAVIVAGEAATWRDYLGTVTDALGVAPEWTNEPVWTGRLLTDRARGWGWAPRVALPQALDELRRGLAPRP
jgi:nucleoside-diphosphate-sugar epimerase